MRRLAVLGRDVSRSLSPRLHNAAIKALGLELEYQAISCPDELAFQEKILELARAKALGVNVTIPYKRLALEIAGSASANAKAIGAANWLSFEKGLFAANFDGPALVAELAEIEQRQQVQILGAGGAARAAAWALKELGAERVAVCARKIDQAEEIAEIAGGEAFGLEPIEGTTLVISTIPRDAELAAQIFTTCIAPERRPFIFDLAYAPPGQMTPMVALAAAHWLPAKDGLGMLIEQAALSLAAWTGADLSQIRRAMTSAL